jgi:hypothetical protein
LLVCRATTAVVAKRALLLTWAVTKKDNAIRSVSRISRVASAEGDSIRS